MGKRFAALMAAGFSGVLWGEGPEEPLSFQGTSFLLEDAYLQEPGVLQHLLTAMKHRKTGDMSWEYSQEWPLWNGSHQLEISLPYLRPKVEEGRGWSDPQVGYQYGLFGSEQAFVTGALSLSVSFPGGSSREGRGFGAVGYGLGFPLSWRFSDRWAAHTNLGVTYIPRARNEEGDRANLKTWEVGQSLVWYAGNGFHVMLEGLRESEEEVAGPGVRFRETRTWMSPGLRWTLDFPGGLQVAPGLAFPVGVGANRGEQAVLFYLCIEHPLRPRK